MNVLDYIIIALAVAAMVWGLFKGFFKLILAALGVVVVSTLTATVEPYVQSWLIGTSMNDGVRNVVAMIVSVLLLSAAYGVIAFFLGKLLRKVKIISALDRILGALIGFAMVYLVFALVFSLFKITDVSFLSKLKESTVGKQLNESWIGNHVYSKNFFGDWVIEMAKQLLEKMKPSAVEPEVPEALATIVAAIA